MVEGNLGVGNGECLDRLNGTIAETAETSPSNAG